ncbi:hypothetical protein B0H15DRAFT_955303 [Mycena belliarum]|uniref:Uncharacterized protein n=1 Tax=Mycena belliarum TaxID=1033014 RepID=A0AAD6TRP1_9AGAR|nr:hypothetical protein B0H15DRAFT_955303 [Mycena belliae]
MLHTPPRRPTVTSQFSKSEAGGFALQPRLSHLALAWLRPEALSFTLAATPVALCATVHVERDSHVLGCPTQRDAHATSPLVVWCPIVNDMFSIDHANLGCGTPLALRPEPRASVYGVRPFIQINVPISEGVCTVQLSIARLKDSGVLSATYMRQTQTWCAAAPSATATLMELLIALMYTAICKD